MKKYSEHPIPNHDPQTGQRNPIYPQYACESCCESNLPGFYSRNHDAMKAVIENYRNKRKMPPNTSYRRCPICHRDQVVFCTESYGYPYFHARISWKTSRPWTSILFRVTIRKLECVIQNTRKSHAWTAATVILHTTTRIGVNTTKQKNGCRCQCRMVEEPRHVKSARKKWKLFITRTITCSLNFLEKMSNFCVFGKNLDFWRFLRFLCFFAKNGFFDDFCVFLTIFEFFWVFWVGKKCRERKKLTWFLTL